VYAASKLLGEWFAADAPRAYVLRVESLFGRAPGAGPAKGSVAGILNTLLAGGSPKVFEDRTVSPTYIMDAARATRISSSRRGRPACITASIPASSPGSASPRSWCASSAGRS